MTTTPWQLGNIPGPKRAAELSAEVAVELIQRAKKPLLVVGPLAFETKLGDGLLVDVLMKLRDDIPVVATAHASKAFIERGYDRITSMRIVELTNKLVNQGQGTTGDGSHDLVIFSGINYPLLSQMLSSLKHFATNLKTISLDRYFQPHADWSFPNLIEKRWENEMLDIVKGLQKKGG